MIHNNVIRLILAWSTSLDNSSRTLYWNGMEGMGGEGGREGGSEGGREGGREEGSKGREGRAGHLMGGTLRRELANIQYIHKPSHNPALALETLVLQMKK